MDLLLYIIFAGVYIMLIHFAMAMKDQFNLFLMIGCFVLGGAIGFWMHSLWMGFVIGVIMSLIFW